MLMVLIGIVTAIIFILYISGVVEFNQEDPETTADDIMEEAKDSLEASDTEAKSFFYDINNDSGSILNDKFNYAKSSRSSPYKTSTTYYESAPQTIETDKQPTLGRQGGAYSMGKTTFVQQGKDMIKDITDELNLAKFVRKGIVDANRNMVVTANPASEIV